MHRVLISLVVLVTILVAACAPPSGATNPFAAAPGAPPVVVAPTSPPTGGGVVPPVATAVPSAPRTAAAPTPDSAGVCYAFHDYGLLLKPEVATSGTAIQVEYWNPAESNIERETFMMAHEARGGRFLIVQPGRDGHVWEYKGSCTEAYMMTQMTESQARRINGGANNHGYVPWRETGLFQPAVAP